LVDEIVALNSDYELEECDPTENQQENLLSLSSHYSDVCIDGVKGLPQTPLVQDKIDLYDDSPLKLKHYVVGK
jgi:hypothetical protein